MHRFLFPSPFPRGRSGIGLLTLRLVVVIATISLSANRLTASGAAPLEMAGAALLVLTSLAVLIGLFTAGAATLLALTLACFSVVGHVDAEISRFPAALFIIGNALAISLLGPGALSVDARLFGPREIVVPRDGRSRP